MASSRHLELSNLVKQIHEKLRVDSESVGVEKAWKKHCTNEEMLKKYSQAMKELSCQYWEHNYKTDSKAISRVKWIYQYTLEYFSDVIIKQRTKECDIAAKAGIHLDIPVNSDVKLTKLHMIDVGSCYNPFKVFNCFKVVPIDIAPANPDVYRCDFLTVALDTNPIEIVAGGSATNSPTITSLQTNSFNVVVFSLFLEYLPSPKQRLICCEKAYQLLVTEGILCIITPDSKHVGANAKFMKTWRFLLAQIGFSRIKYEKLPHIHCMVFRKSVNKQVAQRWAFLQDKKKFYSEFFIPQDFRKVRNVDFAKEFISCENETKSDDYMNGFRELPQTL